MSGGLIVTEAGGDELESLSRLAETAVPIDVVAAGGGVEPQRVAEQLGGDRVFVAESEGRRAGYAAVSEHGDVLRSEEHTSELQSHSDLVCRLLLEKKKHKNIT